MISRITPVKGKEPHEWRVEKYADFGGSEPFVGRLIVGLQEILQGTSLPERDDIWEEMGGITVDCLLPAYASLRELRAAAVDPRATVLSKEKPFDDLCKCLWAAYKDRMQTTARLMGYNIGFLFDNNAKFKAGREKFRVDHPMIKPILVTRMESNRSTWQPGLARYRNNYLEHKAMNHKEAQSYRSLERAESLFDNVWVSIEEILVLLMDTHFPYGIGLRELSESERQQYLPVHRRFGWCFTKPFNVVPPQATNP